MTMRYDNNRRSSARLKLDRCAFGDCQQTGTIHVERARLVCEYHADIIWRKVEWRDATKRHVDLPGMESRDYARADARAKRAVERRKPQSVGEIYFVRIDGLVKVGWSSKLADRIRNYGPKAELLANYPGTRADEAALHRQLTPARHSGREWYSETDIICAFIAETLEKHGPPRFERIQWTEPKRSATKPKSWR